MILSSPDSFGKRRQLSKFFAITTLLLVFFEKNCYKVRHNLLQNVTGITKYDKRLVQSMTGIAKCENYCKVRCNKHNRNNISTHIYSVSRELDLYSSKCGNYLIVGDFNLSIPETNMKNICYCYSLKNLMKEPTCYKNPNNTCIKLI